MIAEAEILLKHLPMEEAEQIHVARFGGRAKSHIPFIRRNPN
jgi:hypothetical protein